MMADDEDEVLPQSSMHHAHRKRTRFNEEQQLLQLHLQQGINLMQQQQQQQQHDELPELFLPVPAKHNSTGWVPGRQFRHAFEPRQQGSAHRQPILQASQLALEAQAGSHPEQTSDRRMHLAQSDLVPSSSLQHLQPASSGPKPLGQPPLQPPPPTYRTKAWLQQEPNLASQPLGNVKQQQQQQQQQQQHHHQQRPQHQQQDHHQQRPKQQQQQEQQQQQPRPTVLHPPPPPSASAASSGHPPLVIIQRLAELQAFFLHVRKARRFGFALCFSTSAGSINEVGRPSREGAQMPTPAVKGVAVSVEDGCCYYLPFPRTSTSSSGGGGSASSSCMHRREGGGVLSPGVADGMEGNRRGALAAADSAAPQAPSRGSSGGGGASAEQLWALTREKRLAGQPRDQMMQGLQVLLTDTRLTKVSYKMKQLHQGLHGHQALGVGGACVDVCLALYLTDPGTFSGAACSSTQMLEQRLVKCAGKAGVAQALQGLPVSGGAPFSAVELTQGEQEALRAAALSRKLYDVLHSSLKKEGLLAPLSDIEMPLVPILAHMEARGMCCNPAVLVKQRIPLQQRLSQLERQACQAVAREFALKSPKQVSEVLFDVLKLKPPPNCSRGKTGTLSTSSDVLQEMVGQHPVVDLILEHRRLAKLEGSMDGLLRNLEAQDARATRIIQSTMASMRAQPESCRGGPGGSSIMPSSSSSSSSSSGVRSNLEGEALPRLRGQFDQTGTATGRLAMDNPNLQTVPRPISFELDGAAGQPASVCQLNMRAAFVASPGHVLLAVDYCQVELRLMAHFCGDKQLCSTMQRDNTDPFIPIAAMWLRCSKNEVTREQRDQAKKLTYAVLYGLGPCSLAQQLATDPGTAHQLTRSFMESMPGLKEWMCKVRNDCRTDGYVTMLSGRRRYLPDMQSENMALRSAAERQAINSKVQGSAADLIKRGMVLLDGTLQQHNLSGAARLVLQVHDELLLEVAAGRQTEVAALVAQTMSQAWVLNVPLPVKISVGPSWGELVEMQSSWHG